MIKIKIIGIDLSAKTENDTGIAIIHHNKLFFKTVFSDEEILAEIIKEDPEVVAIDAPLSLPEGRCCLEKECKCSTKGHFRESDKKMRKYGRVLPLTFQGMKLLTFRGIQLKTSIKMLRGKNSKLKIIETHPRTSAKIMGLVEDKKTTVNSLNTFFVLNKKADELTGHELDSALAALTGAYYIFKKFKELGDPSEGTIIIPDPEIDFYTDMNIFLIPHLL